jgi:hypothetical protein
LRPEAGFVGFLVLTVALLSAVAWTGLRAKRRVHVPLVVLTVASLALAIHFALELGELYDLESAGPITPIHLFVARVATVCYLLPLVSGPLTLRNPRYRKLHGRLAWLVIALTGLAAATGTWMLLAAERLPG